MPLLPSPLLPNTSPGRWGRGTRHGRLWPVSRLAGTGEGEGEREGRRGKEGGKEEGERGRGREKGEEEGGRVSYTPAPSFSLLLFASFVF